MNEGRIESRQRGRALWLEINRGERANSLTAELAEELRSHLLGLDTGSTAVVVIRGTGERAFCAGFDLGRIPAGGATPLPAMMEALSNCPVPTIAMLNGHAIGAGFELACRCDLRVAREGVRVGLPAVRLGVAYRLEGLAAILSAAPAARRLLLTGEQIESASVPGLADMTVSADGLEAAVDSLVAAIGEAEPAALGFTTRALRALRGPYPAPSLDALEAEREAVMARFTPPGDSRDKA